MNFLITNVNNYKKVRAYANRIGYRLIHTSTTGACKQKYGFFEEYICMKDQTHVLLDHRQKTIRGCCHEHALSAMRKRRRKNIKRINDLEITNVDWL